ncbi:hypothetical protein BGZ83_005187 [Gryganskiella cystojenkinii]|nr:hypothetical protein BGZ83_005187 [Gryganskiella cystojenkinii]
MNTSASSTLGLPHQDSRLTTENMQGQFQQEYQLQPQQQRASYPQPPRLTRPASVILEPSTSFQGQELQQNNTRPRSQSHTVYSSYLPPPAAAVTGGSISEPENPVRFQNWRQPAHRSKLSNQYTPSEEDSDEETSAANAEVRRRSKFMSGTPLELNNSSVNGEKPRASSRLMMIPPRSATPSVSDKTDAVSVKSATKKLTLGKRISRFFGGGKSKELASSDSSSQASSDNGRSTDQNAAGTRTSRASSAASLTLPPVQELTTPERLHGSSTLYNLHQRSHSSQDQIGQIAGVHHQQQFATQYGAVPALKLEENKLRKARDSGFEETEGRNGHKRYSSTITVANIRGAVQAGSSLPNLPQQQQPKQQQQQQQHRHSQHLSVSGSPQLRPYSDPVSLQQPPMLSHGTNHRHSFLGAELTVSAQQPNSPRRSSTPVLGETLISKVDREKASVCFQQPSAKRDSFMRDANLDPVLSNLVQQHRKDFKTNQRLGGTPTPQPPQHPQGSPRLRSSMYMDDHHQAPVILGGHGRRDSSGSQHQHYYPPSPGLYASDTQMKRLSTSSQMLLQQQQHPYGQHARAHTASGSQGSLHQYQLPSPQPQHQHYQHHQSYHSHQQQQQQQQQQQHSPLVGPQRTSPKRQSSAGYFSTGSMATIGSSSPLMGAHQPPQPPQMYHISPLPSPSMGAVNTMGHVSDFTLPQQQQHQQHQLEQLQLIRIQQQQLLLQQQIQLQQQLQQTKAAAAAISSPLLMMSAAVAGHNLSTSPVVMNGQQQLQQGVVMGSQTLTTAVPLSAYHTGYP